MEHTIMFHAVAYTFLPFVPCLFRIVEYQKCSCSSLISNIDFRKIVSPPYFPNHPHLPLLLWKNISLIGKEKNHVAKHPLYEEI